jgi:hypothetical protein
MPAGMPMAYALLPQNRRNGRLYLPVRREATAGPADMRRLPAESGVWRLA